jgi:hypothetical protein
MRKFPILALVLCMLVLPVIVSAQGSVTIAELMLEFWPEYDQPAMLVITRVRLSDDTPLPANLSFSIPVDAGEPHAVAVVAEDGGLVNAEYSRIVQGNLALIQLTTPTNLVQFEYYDPNLSVNGADRTYDFAISLDYPVELLTVQIQQPVGARNLTIRPAIPGSTVGADGLTYYTGSFGSFAVNQPIAIGITYDKSGNDLSIASLVVNPAAAEPVTSAPDQIDMGQTATYALLAIGLVLLSFGGFQWWRSRQPQKTSPRHRKRTEKNASVGANRFCHNCGSQALADDKYCRECGTPLRG